MTYTNEITTTDRPVTHAQRRNLADLLLFRGFYTMIEFYHEIIEERDWTEGVEVPEYRQAMDIIRKWSAQAINLADKA